ncbi:MAG: hypothetical protein ACOCQD_01590 [archaeon]
MSYYDKYTNTIINDDHLEELFSKLSPIGLKYYGNIAGDVKIYSNSKIESSVIEICQNSKLTKEIVPGIQRALENRTLLVGYQSKTMGQLLSKLTGFIGKIFNRFIFERKARENVDLGLYDMSTGKIALILDGNVSLMGRIRSMELPPLLVHELVHYISSMYTNRVLKVNFEYPFYTFYDTLTRSICSRIGKNDKKILYNTVKKLLIINEQYDKSKPLTSMNDTLKVWRDFYRNYIDDENKISRYSIATVSSYLDKVLGVKIDKQFIKSNDKALSDAYNSINFKNVFRITVPCQETVYPSEILAITNEISPTPYFKRTLNSIKF